MILRNLTANLRSQNWTAIAIEFAIVVLGVFIGTEVANWNQQRLQKEETNRMLEQLRPELENQIAFFDSARNYYATAHRFAEQAFAGWSGDPRVSDNQFVIAAYQASQVYGIGINSQTWSLAFGSDRLRNIDDSRVRRDLTVILTADYEPLRADAVFTPYRQHVRQVIPDTLQERIRDACGDRDIQREGAQYFIILPDSCSLRLDPVQAAQAARALRAHPELVAELNWHLAEVATYLANMEGLEGSFRQLQKSFERRS